MAWSEAKSISKTADHYDPSQYHDANATWFQKSWWTSYDWGWIYTNDTAMSVKLTKAEFKACAGHSNGKYYDGGAGAPTLITRGYGCVFTSDIYIIDAKGDHIGSQTDVGNCKVESIDSFNCYYNGPGNVCTNHQWTSFGNPAHGWPKPKVRHAIPIAYDKSKSPAVPPGGKLMVIIRPKHWETTSNDALLVMQGDSANFTSELEPEDDDYIWVVVEESGNRVWKRKRKAFMRTQAGWEEMKEG